MWQEAPKQQRPRARKSQCKCHEDVPSIWVLTLTDTSFYHEYTPVKCRCIKLFISLDTTTLSPPPMPVWGLKHSNMIRSSISLDCTWDWIALWNMQNYIQRYFIWSEWQSLITNKNSGYGSVSLIPRLCFPSSFAVWERGYGPAIPNVHTS